MPSPARQSRSVCRGVLTRGGFSGSNVERTTMSAAGAEGSNGGEQSEAMTTGNLIASLWGTGGFVYVLVKSVRKIVPIAAEPFVEAAPAPLTQFQLAAYILTCIWFAYVEGYKGFQLKFSPLVVSRSLTLRPFDGSPIHHILLAPFYSMGLFHATKKRKIVSWSVSLGVAAVVAGVKKLPYPWRNIVDAGVVVGLTWGMISILVEYVKACSTGKSPVDPALPAKTA